MKSKDFLRATNVMRKEVYRKFRIRRKSQFSTSVGGARCVDRERQLGDPWLCERDLPRPRPQRKSHVGAGHSWLWLISNSSKFIDINLSRF